ncbi:hypothetical protein RCCWILLIS_61 [Rhodobacter phage RcCWillis]|nr:hypothetical protein RCCWILLIS_61 [Rhodobacter phage RcCWillis]
MKLGPLRAAIRGTKGNPLIVTRLTADGPEITLALQKTLLLTSLEDAYPGGKAVETGLTFDEGTGILQAEGGAVAAPSAPAAIPAAPEPLDEPFELDLGGLDLTAEPAPAQPSTGLDDLLI